MNKIDLICGNCLEVMKNLPSESVDAVVTDPPYAILKHRIETGIDVKLFLSECKRVLKLNSFLIYFGQQPTLTLWNSLAFKLFNYKSEIIWYKRQRSSPMNDIGRVYENIMVVCNGTRKFNPVRRSWSDVQESLAEFRDISTYTGMLNDLRSVLMRKDKYENVLNYLELSDKRIYFKKVSKTCNEYATLRSVKDIDRYLQKMNNVIYGILPQNLISFIPHNKQKLDASGQGLGDHNIKFPTVKPIQLMEYLIELTTNENDVILDPFMGSGTTGIACRNLNRQFIGIEIDKEYYDIAYQRIHEELPPVESSDGDTSETLEKPQQPKQYKLF